MPRSHLLHLDRRRRRRHSALRRSVDLRPREGWRLKRSARLCPAPSPVLEASLSQAAQRPATKQQRREFAAAAESGKDRGQAASLRLFDRPPELPWFTFDDGPPSTRRQGSGLLDQPTSRHLLRPPCTSRATGPTRGAAVATLRRSAGGHASHHNFPPIFLCARSTFKRATEEMKATPT